MHTVGIDLGTTNAVIGRKGEIATVAPGRSASGILPSVVAYPPDGGVLIGREARERRVFDPENTIISAKRLMGARWGSSQARMFDASYALKLVEMPNGGIGFRTRAGDIDPVGVAASVLGALAHRADVDAEHTTAVVSVPSSFDAAQRQATFDAMARAGFRPGLLVEEPVATAVAYLARSNLRYAAVYDLGGGTFDCAIIDCSRYPFQVVGHAGDPYLGGDDVDSELARRVAGRYLEETGWDLCDDPVTFARLVASCEGAKRRLSDGAWTHIDLLRADPALPEGMPTSVEIDRELLWRLTEPMIRRTFGICDEALAQAGIKARDVQAVFLAGGSTLLPGLRDHVGKYFGKTPRRDIDPMHVVGLGASLVAARPDLSRRFATTQAA